MDWTPSVPEQSRPIQPAGIPASVSSSRTADDTSNDDPWSRATEAAPGVWTVGAESNVGKSVEDPDRASLPVVPEPQTPHYEPAAAQLPRSAEMRDEASTLHNGETPHPAEVRQPVGALSGAGSSAGAGWATSAQYGPATATDPSPAMSGPDVRSIASPAPAAYASPQTPPVAAPEAAPGGTVKQSLYQRLSNSPEAEAGRAKAPARQAEAVKTYVQDTPSPDDETIEESGVFGRAAVERILGGKLVEERSLDGSPIAPRF
jgi:DNA polymerase-3 subunit gamma/tau